MAHCCYRDHLCAHYPPLMTAPPPPWSVPPRPACHNVYNLFHPTNPVACRLEPLLSARFAAVPPCTVCRYHKYPLGDGQPLHLRESPA